MLNDESRLEPPGGPGPRLGPGGRRLVGTRRDRHLPAAGADPLPAVPRPAGVPGLVRPGVPHAVPRADRPGQAAEAVAGGAPGERVAPRDGAARAWAGASTSGSTRRAATTSSTGTTSSSRPWSACWDRGSRAAWSLNWPQHHRPATFLPTDVTVEREPDGSATVWCADLDPFMRLKGMHGVRLSPDSAVVEPAGAALQQDGLRPDVPVVGQRRRAGERPLPVLLPGRRAVRRRPRQARGGVLPPARRPVLRRRLRRTRRRGAPRRRPARLVPQHPRAHVVHGRRVARGPLRRLRPPCPGRLRARRGPPHLPGEEAVDLGQRALRAGVGPQPDGRGRAVHRA